MADNTVFDAVIIYLAGPYSNDAPADRTRNSSAEKRIARFNAITEAARCLIEESAIVYSPLTMTHPIDIRMKHDPGSAFLGGFRRGVYGSLRTVDRPQAAWMGREFWRSERDQLFSAAGHSARVA